MSLISEIKGFGGRLKLDSDVCRVLCSCERQVLGLPAARQGTDMRQEQTDNRRHAHPEIRSPPMTTMLQINLVGFENLRRRVTEQFSPHAFPGRFERSDLSVQACTDTLT